MGEREDHFGILRYISLKKTLEFKFRTQIIGKLVFYHIHELFVQNYVYYKQTNPRRNKFTS